MSWSAVSVVANIFLILVCGILAVDRFYFRSLCKAKHAPLDKALLKMEDSFKDVSIKLHDIWDAIDDVRRSVWMREGRNGNKNKGL